MQRKLNVDVEGDLLVVSLPGTSYRALYFTSPDQLNLVQAPNSAVDKGAPMTHEQFKALAREAATKKARELGWIV
jgi:hypothetical protein